MKEASNFTVVTAVSDGVLGTVSPFLRRRDTQFAVDGKPYWVLRSPKGIHMIYDDKILDLPADFQEIFEKIPEVSAEEIQLYATTTDSSNLLGVLDEISSIIKKYVVLDDPRQYIFLSLWLIHSYAVNSFRITPYVIISGPPGSGKTTLLSVCCKLSPQGNEIMTQPTPAVVYRRIHAEHQAMFLDEYDCLGFESREVVDSILNTGYTYGAKVPRVNAYDYSKIDYFDVFGPKIMTVNDELKLLETLRDRSIIIRMPIRRSTSRLELFDEQVSLLRAKIYAFWKENYGKVMGSVHSFSEPRWRPREEQIARPIMALAQVLGCGEEVFGFLNEYFMDLRDENQFKLEFVLLKNLLADTRVFGIKEYRISDIRSLCESETYGIKDSAIGRKLTGLGLDSNKVRNNGVIYRISKDQVINAIRQQGFDSLIPSARPAELAEQAVAQGES